MSKNITNKIIEEIAVLGKNDSGYTKEINIVSWNDGPAKFDIREWHPGREKSGKGITLTEVQTRNLLDALKEYFKEKGETDETNTKN